MKRTPINKNAVIWDFYRVFRIVRTPTLRIKDYAAYGRFSLTQIHKALGLTFKQIKKEAGLKSGKLESSVILGPRIKKEPTLVVSCLKEARCCQGKFETKALPRMMTPLDNGKFEIDKTLIPEFRICYHCTTSNKRYKGGYDEHEITADISHIQ